MACAQTWAVYDARRDQTTLVTVCVPSPEAPTGRIYVVVAGRVQ